MNQPMKLGLAFGIVLLVAGLAFGSIANAAPQTEPVVFSSEISAFQVPISYTLTVNIVGGGSVTKNPTRPFNQYAPGDNVQLTAVPSDASWTFTKWEGDLTGSANPATIVMTPTSRVVTAAFTQVACYKLNVVSTNGSVTRSLSENCAGGTQYTAGSSIALTATANPGFYFNNWSGCNTTAGAVCNVSMSSDKTVTANYLPCNRLTITINPLNTGNVVPSPTYNCGTSYYLPSTTSVQLTANPATNYIFSIWGGDASGSSNTTSVSMTTNRNVIANFVIQPATAAPPPSIPTATSTTAASSSSTTAAASSSSQSLATITPLLVGGVVVTQTPTPRATGSLPTTGDSPLAWVVAGLVMILIVFGARALRQTPT